MPKGVLKLFSVLEAFSLLFPKKLFLQNPYFLLVCLLLLKFCLCLRSDNSVFAFCSFLRQPLLRKHACFLLFAVSFFRVSPFICYFLLLVFEQTCPKFPFQTQVAFIIGCFVLLLFYCFDYLCLSYLFFDVLVVSLVLISDYDKTLFPCNSSVVLV